MRFSPLYVVCLLFISHSSLFLSYPISTKSDTTEMTPPLETRLCTFFTSVGSLVVPHLPGPSSLSTQFYSFSNPTRSMSYLPQYGCRNGWSLLIILYSKWDNHHGLICLENFLSILNPKIKSSLPLRNILKFVLPLYSVLNKIQLLQNQSLRLLCDFDCCLLNPRPKFCKSLRISETVNSQSFQRLASLPCDRLSGIINLYSTYVIQEWIQFLSKNL